MKITIHETIRNLRKKRKLTQEQLAEAVGVTIGAVSKWESGLSSPDINMLPVLADYFEVSIDVLLGYQLYSQTASSASQRIHELCLAKNYEEGKREAEKALQKYPNYFNIVYESAILYHISGVEQANNTSLTRSLYLYNQACSLISQNTDPLVSELQIQANIGMIYVSLGEISQAIEHFRAYNACGVNNAIIGHLLTETNRYEEALPYLSDSLLEALTVQLHAALGLANYYAYSKQYSCAIEILTWMADAMKGLRYPDKNSYLDKFIALLLTGCAQVASDSKDIHQAESYLTEALRIARQYDSAPDYSVLNIKFYHGKDVSVGDDFGEVVMKGIEKMLSAEEGKYPELLKLYRRVTNGEL